MSFLFSADYYEVRKNGISPAQNMAAYLGGSAIQTVGDNPVTAYRQLVQQYAKGLDGQAVDPKVAASEANAVFLKSPISASLSGLWPRLIGVLFKRIPKFGILLGYGVVTGDKSGKPGFAAATAASILSAPFINPVRMIEKQQRAYFKQTGAEKPLMEIMRESAAKVQLPPTHPPRINPHTSPAGIACCAISFSRPLAPRSRPTPPTPTLYMYRAELHAALPRHRSSDGPLHGECRLNPSSRPCPSPSPSPSPNSGSGPDSDPNPNPNPNPSVGERPSWAGRSAEVAEIRPGSARRHRHARAERVRAPPAVEPVARSTAQPAGRRPFESSVPPFRRTACPVPLVFSHYSLARTARPVHASASLLPPCQMTLASGNPSPSPKPSPHPNPNPDPNPVRTLSPEP